MNFHSIDILSNKIAISGDVYTAKGKYSIAMECYKQSIELIEKHNNEVIEQAKRDEEEMKRIIAQKEAESASRTTTNVTLETDSII
jgi:hypothetical protein